MLHKFKNSHISGRTSGLKTNLNPGIIAVAFILFSTFLYPNLAEASSASYYGSGSSASYYGGGSSATYGGNGSSASYNAPASSYASGDYYDITPVYSSYSDDYYDITPVYSSYSSPYSYGGYSSPSYQYTPQPTYSYVPVGGRGSGGGSSAPQLQYVYSSNENKNSNANANENNNNVNNTFNPTNINNNDARINLVVYGGNTSTPAPEPTYQNYQYTPTYTQPNYAYDTSYTNTYSYPPAPTYVYNNPQSNLGTPVSGVFLSQVPATGIDFGLKMTLFSVGLVLWSLFAAFMIARKKNSAVLNKINAFKLANMQKKGIVG